MEILLHTPNPLWIYLFLCSIPLPCLKGDPCCKYFPTPLTSGDCSFSHCHVAQNQDRGFLSSVLPIITCQKLSPLLTSCMTAAPLPLSCQLPPLQLHINHHPSWRTLVHNHSLPLHPKSCQYLGDFSSQVDDPSNTLTLGSWPHNLDLCPLHPISHPLR